MITAILVDDEMKSLMNLELLLNQHCPGIKVIGTATNALQAVTKVMSEKARCHLSRRADARIQWLRRFRADKKHRCSDHIYNCT